MAKNRQGPTQVKQRLKDQTIDYLILFIIWTFSRMFDYFYHFRMIFTILEYIGQFLLIYTVLDNLGLFTTILDNIGPFWAILENL